jgi:hypothetical protein
MIWGATMNVTITESTKDSLGPDQRGFGWTVSAPRARATEAVLAFLPVFLGWFQGHPYFPDGTE